MLTVAMTLRFFVCKPPGASATHLDESRQSKKLHRPLHQLILTPQTISYAFLHMPACHKRNFKIYTIDHDVSGMNHSFIASLFVRAALVPAVIAYQVIFVEALNEE